MPEIVITQRDKQGTQAKVVISCTVTSVEHLTDKQFAEMLLDAEMNGNSSGKVRVHFDNFGYIEPHSH